MRTLKTQYFLIYAVVGALLPYLPLFLEQRGLTESQVGYLIGVMALAGAFTPVLVAFLADTRVSNRVMLSVSISLAGAMVLVMASLEAFIPLLAAATLYSIVGAPMIPLQDVAFFKYQQFERAAGRPPATFHKVRVWGSFGFIAPSIPLYFLLSDGYLGYQAVAAIVLTGVMAFVAASNAILFLPRDEAPTALADAHASWLDRLPTWSAAKVLLQQPLIAFCLASFLVQVAAGVFYAFFPAYLTGTVGLPRSWVGLIISVGVACEVIFMLNFGRIVERVGFRGMLLFSCAGVAVRMLILTALPLPAVVIVSQFLHGPLVLLIHIAPPVLINHYATDANRNSVQALFFMAIWSCGRLLGSVTGGWVAEINMIYAFAYATALSVAGFAVYLLALPWLPPIGIGGAKEEPRPEDLELAEKATD